MTPTASVAVTSNVTDAPDGSDEVVDMLDGTVMVGRISSVYVTVTVKSSVPVFPAASDAVQVTVVGGPTEKNEPEAGEQVGPEVTLTLSVAVTSNVTDAPDGSDEVVDMLDGTVMVGRISSVYVTVTVKSSVPVFPDISVAVQVTVVVLISKCPEKPKLTV